MRSARVATKSVSGSAKANARGVTVPHGTATAFAPKAPSAGPAVAPVASGSGPTPSGGEGPPQNFSGTDAYDYPPRASNVGMLTDLGAAITQFPWARLLPRPGWRRRLPLLGRHQQQPGSERPVHRQPLRGRRWPNYFYTNFAFSPAYDATLAAPRQLGTFTARQAWTWSTWLTNGILAVDLGALVLMGAQTRTPSPARIPAEPPRRLPLSGRLRTCSSARRRSGTAR